MRKETIRSITRGGEEEKHLTKSLWAVFLSGEIRAKKGSTRVSVYGANQTVIYQAEEHLPHEWKRLEKNTSQVSWGKAIPHWGGVGGGGTCGEARRQTVALLGEEKNPRPNAGGWVKLGQNGMGKERERQHTGEGEKITKISRHADQTSRDEGRARGQEKRV